MTFFRTLSAAMLLASLTGCVQVFDSVFNSVNPHSLSASRGEGTRIDLGWVAPDLEEDGPSVDRYRIYRDGMVVGTSSSPAWSDSDVEYGRKYSYEVDAELSNGSDTGTSNADTGWCVSSTRLQLGKQTAPRTTRTSTGWYKTLVAEGWTYRFVSSVGGPLDVFDIDDPEERIARGTDGTLTWVSDRSELVWISVPAETASVTAWYE